MLGSCAFGSTLGGAVSKKKNFTSQTLVIATGLQILGLGLLYGFASHDTSIEKHFMLGFTSIYGFGIGLCFAACTIIGGIEARNDDLATAQGAIAQARVFGGALGLAACAIIFNESLNRAFNSKAAPSLNMDDISRVHRSPIAILGLNQDQINEVKPVYLEAFRNQLLAMLVIAIVAFVGSFFTYRRRPAPILEALRGHQKEFSVGSSDEGSGVGIGTELESASSIRSLIR